MKVAARAIGGLCIYLGHRLFFHIPGQTDGEANLKLPGGIPIFITRVGAGVFLALFGACVVSDSALRFSNVIDGTGCYSGASGFLFVSFVADETGLVFEEEHRGEIFCQDHNDDL